MISFSKHNRFKFVRICYHVIVLHAFIGITSFNLKTIRSEALDYSSRNSVVVCKILCKSEPSKKNVSLMNMLKNTASSIDPYGMSDGISFKKLKLFLILTHCLCPLRYDSISFRVLVSKPYSSRFATSKSSEKQLKAFDRSIRVTPTILFSSRHLRHVSIILKRTC